MSDTAKAVFLSYAREDTAAAQRIAEALRSHGVEVWFDQSELRGGDAWDQKIRRQINECSLFLPVISQNTQERHKGYFRLEWKLGVEQTHQMAEGVAFIAPVVVDNTSESSAVVPAEFMRVQWTRLPGALPTPQFVEQIKLLLEAPHKPTSATRAAFPVSSSPSPVGPTQAPRRRFPLAVAAVAALVLAGVGYFALRPSAPPADKSGLPTDKSIAVLPFANMSEDKENSAVMADGIHDDILINLSLIREFRIPASVDQYRNTTKPSLEIARELRVAYIMKGSVVRDGSRVRVTGQLINARTDEIVWSKPYDGSVADGGLFTLQAAIAKEIAAALKTALSPEERSLVERRPTQNNNAYDLYLKARELRRANFGPTTIREAEALLQAAVAIDRKFAIAWSELAFVHSYLFYFNIDHSEEIAAKAKVEIETAVQLAPEQPEIIENRGYYLLHCLLDFRGAEAEFERLQRLRPTAGDARFGLAAVQRTEGRWKESLEGFRAAAERDPGSYDTAVQVSLMARAGRRWEELKNAVLRQQEVGATAPGNRALALADLDFRATGTTRDLESAVKGMADSDLGLELRQRLAVVHGGFSELLLVSPPPPAINGSSDFGVVSRALVIATALIATGKTAEARALVADAPASLRVRLQREPTNPVLWSNLGLIEAILGNNEEAIRCATRAVELVPESANAYFGPVYRIDLALVKAWSGRTNEALTELSQLLRTPMAVSGNSRNARTLNIHVMRYHPFYYSLQGDPRFEALLKDPKNNAPLF